MLGLRTEEIVPLEINDIDFENRKININKAVYFENGKPHLKETKNKKTRKLPIFNILYNSLEDYVKKLKSTNQDLLFVKQTNKEMLTASAVRWMLESFLIEMNSQYEKEQKEIDNQFKLTNENKIHFTDHVLRHSFCTMLYYAGVGIKEAQELMGHSSAQMVYDIYTHLDMERSNTDNKVNDYIDKMYSL